MGDVLVFAGDRAFRMSLMVLEAKRWVEEAYPYWREDTHTHTHTHTQTAGPCAITNFLTDSKALTGGPGKNMCVGVRPGVCVCVSHRNRSAGRDHIWVFTHDEAPCYMHEELW